jgi:hypothetical protein
MSPNSFGVAEIPERNAVPQIPDLPEPFTEFVKVGAEADLTVGQVPGQKFPAQVIGTAGVHRGDRWQTNLITIGDRSS